MTLIRWRKSHKREKVIEKAFKYGISQFETGTMMHIVKITESKKMGSQLAAHERVIFVSEIIAYFIS